MLEIVYDALAIKKIHCRTQKVPVERFGEPQAPRSTWYVGDSDHFSERYNLDGSHEDNHVNVSSE